MACHVLLEQMFERTCDVCREYEYNSAESGPCCDTASPFADLFWWCSGINLPCCFFWIHWSWSSPTMLLNWFTLFSLPIFACCDFIERSTTKNFWLCSSCFLLLQRTHADQQRLMISLLLSHSCWSVFDVLHVTWTGDNEDWNHVNKLLLSRSKPQPPLSY